jgi:hypothetical protein
MDAVRMPESWAYIKQNCPADSELLKFGQLMEKYLGPATEKREKELNEWHSVLDTFLQPSDWVTPREQHRKVHCPDDSRLKTISAHLKPVEIGLARVWDHYTCLRLFDDVPVEGSEFRAMMDYVRIIDAK